VRPARALLTALALAAFAAAARAQPAAAPCAAPIAKVVSVQGTVETRAAGATEWQAVAPNQARCPGDAARAGGGGRADVMQQNQTMLRLNANTTMTLEAPGQEGGASVVSLLTGAAHLLSRRPANLEVRTPYTVAGVRGTEFFVGVDADSTAISVFEGTV